MPISLQIEKPLGHCLVLPRGYIGSDRPGLLPYAISQNPKQVILIDEIEKAEQGFYQFLLQMLDEGYVIERFTGYAYYLNRT